MTGSRWSATFDRAGVRWRSSLPGHAWRESQRLDLGTHALAIAAQQVLCTAPLLVAVSSVMRRFQAGSAGSLLIDFLDLDGASAADIRALFRATGHPGLGDLMIGFTVALAFTAGVATTTQRALEVIWGRPRAGWQTWWVQPVWALTLVPSIVGAIYLTRVTNRWTPPLAAEIAMQSAVFGAWAFVFYWWTQWLLLLRRVPAQRLAPGAAFVGLGFAIVAGSSAIWIPGQVATQVVDYGHIGATFVLSIWVVVLASVMVGGIVLGAVLDRRRAHTDH